MFTITVLNVSGQSAVAEHSTKQNDHMWSSVSRGLLSRVRLMEKCFIRLHRNFQLQKPIRYNSLSTLDYSFIICIFHGRRLMWNKILLFSHFPWTKLIICLTRKSGVCPIFTAKTFSKNSCDSLTKHPHTDGHWILLAFHKLS